jgi:FkbM family methyltransferase
MIYDLVKKVCPDLSFKIIEVGARLIEGNPEPFYPILDHFPNSSIVAFEVEPELCEQNNQKGPKNIRFYPIALAKNEEERDFYETNHPMCGSLYPPDDQLLDKFCALEVANFKQLSKLKTMGLDQFSEKYQIGAVDFIKIDIQGAELEVFESGVNVLKDVLAIVTEVEFLPLYKNQPLFGDVNTFLNSQGFLFDKFLGLAGRSLKPVVINNDPNYGLHHLWADSFFMRNYLNLETYTDEQLLKMSILANIYSSPDIAYNCLKIYDDRNLTVLGSAYLSGK